MEIELTKDEVLAIRALKRVAARWPETLWIFCDGNSMKVCKKNAEGRQAFVPRSGAPAYDHSYIVGEVMIESDGGAG